MRKRFCKNRCIEIKNVKQERSTDNLLNSQVTSFMVKKENISLLEQIVEYG